MDCKLKNNTKVDEIFVRQLIDFSPPIWYKVSLEDVKKNGYKDAIEFVIKK